MQFSARADVIVFTALALIMAVGLVVAIVSPEAGRTRPGAARSLIPTIAIPRAARAEFLAAIPAHLSAWMLAALFMGLAPTIILHIFHIDSGLVNGATAFAEPGAAAAAGFILGRFTPRRVSLVGGISVVVGTAVIVSGVALQLLPLLIIGGVIGGIGFGASFSGALRTITPLAQPGERAGLYAGVYTIAYLAFGVPSIIAGLLLGQFGLLPIVAGYAIAVLLIAAAGLVAQARIAHR